MKMNAQWLTLMFLMFISCARCVVVSVPALSARSLVEPDVKYDDWRLPRSLLPRQYKVRLLPFLIEGNFTTHGRVEILLECMEETDLVVIHMADITIVKDTLQISNLIELRSVKIHSYVEDKQREFLLISTKNDTMQVGKFYQLSMDFVGQLNDNLNGFYRSSYMDNGVKKYLATTQFSPTDARRAFPCFDEPGMKAKFQITMGRKTFQTSRSNMPLKRTTLNYDLPGYVWDEYETTLPMSTYILAFIVSEFEGVDAPPVPGSSVHFRIWSRPSAVNQTEYARIMGPRVLSYLEGYFNVSFPLPKQDMFAIPDFAVGAMENWGLVTYRETSLLYDPVQSSAINQQRVASVIAHELAHQWFGNLVTMEWWNDLWLKEGFAVYMESVAVDAVDSKLQIGEQFSVEETQSVFGVDALTTSHPMSVPVNKRNDINELFDSIPYSKGPAVIRMLSNFMSEESFRRGLTLYLNTRKYQNAVQDDLWDAMNEVAIADGLELPADVKTIMNSWSLQTGYPVVTIQRNYENQSAIITQERFYLLSERQSSESSLWWVPLTFTCDFSEIYTGWMFGDEEGMELDINTTSEQWIIFNVNQVGYYRVNYDLANWKLLIEQLRTNHSKISSMSRAQLIDDSFELARTGKVAYSTALELLKYLRMERHYVPWRAALGALDYIDAMLYDTPSGKALREFWKQLLLPVLEEVGFDEGPDDPHLLLLNRNQIIGAACQLSMPQCVGNATSLYQKWMKDPDNNRISSNLQRVVTCAGVANGGDDEWNFAYQRYLLTNLANEKETLLNAMSCSRNSKTLDRLLQWSLDSTSGIRRQDVRAVFANVASNPLGQSKAFNFLIDNWNEMVTSFPSLYVLGRIVDSVSLTLNTERDLTNLIELSKGDLGTATRSIQQAIERTRINLEWMKRHNERAMPVSLSSLFGSSDPQLLLF